MQDFNIKRFCLFSILTFIAALSSGGDSFAGRVGAAYGPDEVKNTLKELSKQFPASEAVIITDSLAVTLHQDGRIDRRVHRFVALFTDDAVHRYGDPRVLFNASKQRLSVKRARVYMREGKIVDTQKNGINQTTPVALASAADYTPWQETVVTHVGIEKPCIAELWYAITDKEPFMPACSGVEFFSEDDPVLERVVQVTVPPRAKLVHAELNGAPAPTVTNKGRTYTWTMKRIEASRSVRGSVDPIEYLPAVIYSNEENWSAPMERIARWFDVATRNRDFAVDPLGGVEKKSDDAACAVEIQRKAAGVVKGVEAPFAQFELEPRDAERVYDTSYGDSFDRAVLLGALLKEEGYQPYPVLVSRGRMDVEGLPPALELFDRILIAVPIDGVPLLLDPTKPYERPPELSLPGASFLCSAAESSIKVNGPLKKKNIDSLELDISFDGSDLVCRGKAELEGVFSPYWIIRGTDGELERYLEKRAHSLLGGNKSIIEGAELVSCNIEKLNRDDVALGFELVVKDLLEGKDRLYIDLPEPIDQSAGGLDDIDITGSEAKAPFGVIPQRCVTSVRISKPAGWRFAALPWSDSQTGDVGAIKTLSKRESDELVSVKREIVLKAGFVSVSAYRELRSLIVADKIGTIVLEKE